MRILGISGSLRRGSHNTALLRAAGRLLPPGAQLTIYDGLREIPPYDDDMLVAPPQAVVDLRAAVAAADAVLIATPEYNSSIPGVLKNALDWLSRPLGDSPLRNKPAAVVGASTGMFGAVWAQAETRKVLSAIGARVVDRELPVPRAHELRTGPIADPQGAEGELQHEEIEAELASIVAELHDQVREREAALA